MNRELRYFKHIDMSREGNNLYITNKAGTRGCWSWSRLLTTNNMIELDEGGLIVLGLKKSNERGPMYKEITYEEAFIEML